MKYSIRILSAFLIALLLISSMTIFAAAEESTIAATEAETSADDTPTTVGNQGEDDASKLDFSLNRLPTIIPKALEGFGITILVMCVIILCVYLMNLFINRPTSQEKKKDGDNQQNS